MPQPPREPIIIPYSTLKLQLPDAIIAPVSAIAAHQGWSVDYLIEQVLANYLDNPHCINMDALEIARDQYRDAQLQGEKEGAGIEDGD